MSIKQPLVLLALNEINFDIACHYAEKFNLLGIKKLLEGNIRRTSSELNHEDLEPWIQWVSAQTGQTAQEHGVFRLGDIEYYDEPQFFEQIEQMGYRVGAISPMNAVNRLSRPSYFIPDPWTSTPSDGSFWGRHLTKAVAQAVNDNAEGRLEVASALTLALGVLRFAKPKNYALYLKLALKSWGAPWRRALFLDLFLNDLHQGLRKHRLPHFSMLFLNGGAHIQHHYMLSSEALDYPRASNPEWYIKPSDDPMAEMFIVYDRIIRDYVFDLSSSLILATGLQQVPYRHPTFYYRLREHRKFLERLGIKPVAVKPRMTRDFLVEFRNAADADSAQRILESIVSSTDDVPLFEEIENRGNSLFVTLTYPNEILDETCALGAGQCIQLKSQTVFVAIKNGMHDARGYVYCQGDVECHAPKEGDHIKSLHSTVIDFFSK